MASKGLAVLNVKLARPVTAGVPATLQRPGVVQVTRRFPDEDDQELSTLYVLQVDAGRAEAILRTLRRNPGGAYAEPSAPRKAVSVG